jgi:serine/threonine-protein kinase
VTASDTSRFAPWRHHAIVAAVAFAVAWFFVAVVVFPDTGPAPTVIVPPVVGMPFAQAEAKLDSLGLRASLGESRPSNTAPRRYVLGQTPAAGTSVEPDVTVMLDVSAGQLRATVPRLVGMTRDDAISLLRSVRLEPGRVIERPAQAARGTVLSTDPDAGQVVPEGSSVEFVLSAGPSLLLMPDVAGRELYEVRAMLEQLGLRVAETEYDSTSVLPAGLVISQVPAAGSPVTATDFITLRVSGRP